MHDYSDLARILLRQFSTLPTMQKYVLAAYFHIPAVMSLAFGFTSGTSLLLYLKKNGLIEKPIIFKDNKQINPNENLLLNSHFDINKINNTFKNLNSLNILQLIDVKKENDLLGYSSKDIDLHLLKIISLPIYLAIMVIISSIIMLNIPRNKPYIFHILLGILLSVIIYYINNIFNIFGLTNKIPTYLSVFFPIILLSIISLIGLIRINEK